MGALLLGGAAALAVAAGPGDETLTRAAYAVLEKRCFACHGPSRMSGLDLRSRDGALKGGKRGAALRPAEPENSLLAQVTSGRNALRMPPSGPLPLPEQELLRQWIAAGAPYPPGAAAGATGWAFRPLVRPDLPWLKDASWARSPIDRFVLARLNQKGLRPAPPAPPVELLRRATFDLTGLPPAPEDLERFLADPAPDRYERLVDRLLASPAFGERWARHWLDVARFAESQGFERDKIRDHAWRYRDYVIRAFNEDRPYDQFVREQVAGDVLPGATTETVTATGFLVAGPYDEVGKTQISELMKARVRQDEMEDMLAAVGQTFLGLTVNCARCHDHKFDPIPQADYYRLQAAFFCVEAGDRTLLPPAEQKAAQERLARLREALAQNRREMGGLERAARSRPAGASPPATTAVLPAPLARWTFLADGTDSAGALDLDLRGKATIADGRLRLNGVDAAAVSGPLPWPVAEKTLEVWVSLAGLDQRGAGVVTLEDPAGRRFDSIVYGERQPRKWIAGSTGFSRTRDLAGPEESSPPGTLVHLVVTYEKDGRIAVYRNGTPYGQPYLPPDEKTPLLRLDSGQARIAIGRRHGDGAAAGDGRWLKGEIEETRFYGQALTAAEVAASYQAGPDRLTEADLASRLSPGERERRTELRRRLTGLEAELRTIQEPPLVYGAMPSGTPAAHLLARGDVQQKGEPMRPAGLSCLPGLAADLGLAPDAPDADRRTRLAAWLTDPANPLTPRVMVNRIWQHLMGRGIVGTPNDFGVMGEKPTHPELLDWLAVEFTSGGPPARKPWSVKSLVREIVLSSTYRQSARFDARAAALDADNRLLWRHSPQRLEAEEIRDAMLAVSGQLNPQAAGPGFRPFTVTINNSHFYAYEDREGPEYNRRSIYRTVVNSGGIPLLETFDCPDPSVKTPRRGQTITPLQALALLNNSFVLRQAREFAARLTREAGSEPARQVDRAYRLALGRPPTSAETARDALFVREHGLPAYCRVLFNASEFVFVR